MSDKVIQNKIVLGLLKEFEEAYGLLDGDEAKSFERLANYVVLSKVDPEAFSDPIIFDVIDVDKNVPGKKSTFGIDAFALFINDNLITSTEEIEQHRKTKRMEVRFVFIQTKRSTSIDSGDFLKFTKAVKDVFTGSTENLSEDLQRVRELIEEIFKPDNARLFANRKPRCELFFVTAGSEIKDEWLLKLIESEERDMQLRVPEVQPVQIRHIGADFIIDSYSEIENKSSVLITFDKNVPCERIDDVEQAFIGYLPISEFLKLITGSDGNIRKNIFYENVRDFQGLDNSVNSEIGETLSDDQMLDKFILLNNGVTVVAKEFTNIRSTEYEISNYYVVNGCQTSNMIFRAKDRIAESAKLKIPVKLIHTNSNDVIAKLIRSTNKQTPVPDEAFVSLEKFHKRLQEFYRTFPASPETLYYERRSKEFSGTGLLIEKPRIISLHAQIRSFVSVILNEPQLVMTNDPSTILKMHREKLFTEEHKQIPYYLSALLLYMFYRLHQEGKIDRKDVKSRYWICWIARVLASGGLDVPPMNSGKVEKLCDTLIANLQSKVYVTKLFTYAIQVFEKAETVHTDKFGYYRRDDLIRLRSFRDEVKSVLVHVTQYVKSQSLKTDAT